MTSRVQPAAVVGSKKKARVPTPATPACHIGHFLPAVALGQGKAKLEKLGRFLQGFPGPSSGSTARTCSSQARALFSGTCSWETHHRESGRGGGAGKHTRPRMDAMCDGCALLHHAFFLLFFLFERREFRCKCLGLLVPRGTNRVCERRPRRKASRCCPEFVD